MLSQFAAPLFLFLLVLHAMVGYVELGTDSWITDIMNNEIPGMAVLLFIYTSAIMFVLRFFAGPIVEKISPVGLLFCQRRVGRHRTVLPWASARPAWRFSSRPPFMAWERHSFGPRCSGVVGERFPRGGALTMGTIGGVGMLSAGLLGRSGHRLQAGLLRLAKAPRDFAPETFERYVSPDKKSFLFLPAIAGLDGSKVGTLKDKVADKQPLTPEEQTDRPFVEEASRVTAEKWPSNGRHLCPR